MYDALLAETITIRGDGGDEIEAYLARPMSQGPYGGVVVIHHMPGYDEPTNQPAADLAALAWTDGTDALAPLLAPAVANHVIPMLRTAALLRDRG